ncbi:MAG: hypothetical protein Kapaf2KO_24010 [Candidatus Kapaibacteriales bacterium]
MRYLKNLLISFDQLGNTIAGGNPDNTISSRLGHFLEKEKTGSKASILWILLAKIV